MAALDTCGFVCLEVVLGFTLLMDTEVFQSLETSRSQDFRCSNFGNAFRPSAGPHTNTMAPDDASPSLLGRTGERILLGPC